jgi:hypothetical protein
VLHSGATHSSALLPAFQLPWFGVVQTDAIASLSRPACRLVRKAVEAHGIHGRGLGDVKLRCIGKDLFKPAARVETFPLFFAILYPVKQRIGTILREFEEVATVPMLRAFVEAREAEG